MKNRFTTDTLLLSLALAVTAAVHLPALRNFPVGDSWIFLEPHTLGETFRYLFTSIIPIEHEAFWLRPIPMFTFWLDGILWPGSTWGPHLTSVIVHLLNVWLVFLLVRKALGVERSDSKKGVTAGAFFAALLYGVHPLTAGSVSWIAARFDLMAITFGLAGLAAWLKWDERHTLGRLATALLLLILSLLSKEQGIVFMAVCGVLSIWRLISDRTRRDRAILGLILIGSVLIVYGLWRLLIFGGIGGYQDAPEHGMSVVAPLSYLITLVFPFVTPMVVKGHIVGLVAAIAGCVAAGTLLWRRGRSTHHTSAKPYLIAFLILFSFGIATTIPHPSMTFNMISRHAEARFALIALTGLALSLGIGIDRLLGMKHAFRQVVMVLAVVAAAFCWRCTVQVGAWHHSGESARGIVAQTRVLVPDPPDESLMIFIDIPRENDAYAYIFGIGLSEAVHAAYGRDDLDVVRYPKREDFRRANPARDAVLQFHPASGRLERLQAVASDQPSP
jgi:hypothetical protein